MKTEDNMIRQYWLRGVLAGALLVFAGLAIIYFDGWDLGTGGGKFSAATAILLIATGVYNAVVPVQKRLHLAEGKDEK
jgi:hypothetical protein